MNDTTFNLSQVLVHVYVGLQVCMMGWISQRVRLVLSRVGWVTLPNLVLALSFQKLLGLSLWNLPMTFDNYQYCPHAIRNLLTSFPYCNRMSLNFFIICELIASRERMFLNLSSMSKAPSAERSVLKDSLMKCLASSSMAATSLLNHSMTLRHWSWCFRPKGSKLTWGIKG